MKQLLIIAALFQSAACSSAFAERNPCDEGDVEVAVLIDSNGHVKSVNILNESPCQKFNEEARRLALSQRWEPAMRSGLPVSSAKKYRYHLRLDERFVPTAEGAPIP
jgi:TonB family protein